MPGLGTKFTLLAIVFMICSVTNKAHGRYRMRFPPNAFRKYFLQKNRGLFLLRKLEFLLSFSL